MSITRINRSVVNGTTVSMVLVDGVYEVAAFANGDEICATVRTTDIDAAERTFAATVARFSGPDLLAKFWAESATASVLNAYRTGSFRTVTV